MALSGSTAPTGASWPTTDRLTDHGAYMQDEKDGVWAIFAR
jgi:hypothetical protein